MQHRVRSRRISQTSATFTIKEKEEEEEEEEEEIKGQPRRYVNQSLELKSFKNSWKRAGETDSLLESVVIL
jgi:hypothetical protein